MTRRIWVALLALGCAGRPVENRVTLEPEPGETHLSNIRQLTFGGTNAEAYFSASGKQIIFQGKPTVKAATRNS